MATVNASTALVVAQRANGGETVSPSYSYSGGLAAGDVLNVVTLAVGHRVTDVQVITDAANAGVSIDVGHAPVDGGPGDPDAFIDDASIAQPGRVRANTPTAPEALGVESYLTLTPSDAVSAGTTITVILTLSYDGTP